MRSIQTFETLPRTYIPASDRILWLWLILTESELWRTLAESLLRKVIPIRTIVSAPSRAKDMALSMHKRYRCCPTPALTLTTMVLLNVAATRGPAALWPGYKPDAQLCSCADASAGRRADTACRPCGNFSCRRPPQDGLFGFLGPHGGAGLRGRRHLQDGRLGNEVLLAL